MPISSIARGPRLTNFELLRIIAMLMVITIHANFSALGEVTRYELDVFPQCAWTRLIIEAFCISAVNTFVMISGWFGIKPSFKGLGNLLFQCAYFSFGLYAVLVAFGKVTLNLEGIANCFYFNNGLWFIKAYICLYLFTPMLNMFLERTSKRTIEFFLIGFYLLQTLYGFNKYSLFYNEGLGGVSFLGLYVLARYLRVYKPQWHKWGFWLYIIGVAIICWQYTHPGFWSGKGFHARAYVNPAVILCACGLVMGFSTLKMPHNRFINWVSASTFAAYLFHMDNGGIQYKLYAHCRDIFYHYSGIDCIWRFCVLILTFFSVAILLDQPRRWLWKMICKQKDIK